MIYEEKELCGRLTLRSRIRFGRVTGGSVQ